MLLTYHDQSIGEDFRFEFQTTNKTEMIEKLKTLTFIIEENMFKEEELK